MMKNCTYVTKLITTLIIKKNSKQKYITFAKERNKNFK